MARTLMCLPLCLLLAPGYPGASLSDASLATKSITADESSLPPGSPDPKKDVIGFLEFCLKRYQDNVKGYTCSFRKREFMGGKLKPWETIAAAYREQPHSAYFDWQEGAGRAMKAMYVEGENKNPKGQSQLLVLPTPPLNAFGPVKVQIDSEDSKSSGRYQLHEFGLKQALQRVLNTWKPVAAKKELNVEYLGLHAVPEAGGQICHKIRRFPFVRPEGDDKVTDAILFIDRETLFQVGTIIRGEKDQLLGEYYFRDIRVNPVFPANQFEASIMKAKK